MRKLSNDRVRLNKINIMTGGNSSISNAVTCGLSVAKILLEARFLDYLYSRLHKLREPKTTWRNFTKLWIIAYTKFKPISIRNSRKLWRSLSTLGTITGDDRELLNRMHVGLRRTEMSSDAVLQSSRGRNISWTSRAIVSARIRWNISSGNSSIDWKEYNDRVLVEFP